MANRFWVKFTVILYLAAFVFAFSANAYGIDRIADFKLKSSLMARD